MGYRITCDHTFSVTILQFTLAIHLLHSIKRVSALIFDRLNAWMYVTVDM